MSAFILSPGSVPLDDLFRIYRQKASIKLDRVCRTQVEHSALQIEAAAKGHTAIYGVNTGFGKLANHKIESEETSLLQRNLILSHCCGVGASISTQMSRLILVLKLLSLGRGASGVRWEVIELMENMLRSGVTPVIPSQGSVGASGDLSPLAHMSAVLIGEGKAEYLGNKMSGGLALSKAGLAPIALGPKEGLALINGTQFSTAFALAGLFEAWTVTKSSLIVSAISTDAIMGSTSPLQPEIHSLRGHRGQIEVASAMRAILAGSEIRESHREADTRVQDPYCIRCQPQVTGAAMDVMRQAAQTLRIEANAATDNPLFLNGISKIVSGGNFHAEPVGFAADMIALALSEVGSISQRRVALMVDPALSFDLPPFLTPNPGLNSGYMIAEVTTAALMSENKHLANPCVTDSTPTSANQEDHVSMAAHGSFRLLKMIENLKRIVGIELLCSAQGVEFRLPLKTSAALMACIRLLRETVPSLESDRYLADDIETASRLVGSDEFSAHLSYAFPELDR